MRTGSTILCALSLLLAVTGGWSAENPAPVQPADSSKPEVAADLLAAAVDSLFGPYNRSDAPGAAVVLTDGSRVVLERCYGLADMENRVPITPATRFELASVSKNFTAFGVLLLARQGRLGLDDGITKHLPELPEHGITIRHLLNQTSGVSECLRLLPYAGIVDLDRLRLHDVIDMLQHQKSPDFAPGSRWAYSNTNYILLAEIVKRVTGQPFGAWMTEQVFQPMKMYDTSFSDDGNEILPNRANAYSISNGALVRRIVGWPDLPGPAHLFSTIRDMAKWMDNFRTGRHGGPDLIADMVRKPVLANGKESGYGFGLGIGDYRGVRTFGHSGQTGSFRSEMIYCPDLEVGVAVLTNYGKVKPARLARSILDLYLGDRLAPVPPTEQEAAKDEARPFVKLEPSRLDRFVGAYRLESDPSARILVAREGDVLAGILGGIGMDLFMPLAESEFENQLRNTQITFVDGLDGRTARMRVVLKGKEMWAERVPFEKDPARSAEYAGLYYCDEWGTVYEIVAEKEEFVIRHRRMGDRPMQEVEADRLAGGMGMLTFFRNGAGKVAGFVFEEPEDLPGRQVAFSKFVLAAPGGLEP
jgi:CubicO group peptidase (beta-lactamase class C family)